jgi:hypothetical protein
VRTLRARTIVYDLRSHHTAHTGGRAHGFTDHAQRNRGHRQTTGDAGILPIRDLSTQPNPSCHCFPAPAGIELRHATRNMHSAQSVLGDNQDSPADEADARATRAAHRRSAVCAGAQRAAAAAALEAQATLPGSSTSCSQKGAQPLAGAAGEAHASFPVPYAQPMFFLEAQPTSDPSGMQRRVCNLWARVPGGAALSQQCSKPMSRCTARSSGSSSHLVVGNARQVHRNDMSYAR